MPCVFMVVLGQFSHGQGVRFLSPYGTYGIVVVRAYQHPSLGEPLPRAAEKDGWIGVIRSDINASNRVRGKLGRLDNGRKERVQLPDHASTSAIII